MTLGTNILETKLIAIIFFDHAYVLARIVHSNHVRSYIKYFVFNQLDLACLTMADERRQNTRVSFRSGYLEANKQS